MHLRALPHRQNPVFRTKGRCGGETARRPARPILYGISARFASGCGLFFSRPARSACSKAPDTARGLRKPRKSAMRTTSLNGPRTGRPAALPAHGKPLKGPFLCLGILAARKQVDEFLDADLACYLVFLQLVLDILLYLLPVPSYCARIMPSGPEMPVSLLAVGIY